MESLKLQKDVRDNCEEFRNTLNEMQKWEMEIKEQEKLLKENPENEQIPAVRRSPGQESILQSRSDVEDITHSNNEGAEVNISSLKEEAEKCKLKGNSHVKQRQYKEGASSYTEAINKFSGEPIFYTNRAFCYLKLEMYNECVADCNIALSMNPRAVKALYRRMQAYEYIGNYEKAFEDVKEILKIEPKNKEALNGFNKIKTILDKGNAKNIAIKPSFMKLEKNMKIIKPIEKSAHLRSKKALRKITIEETIGSTECKDKDNKNIENSSIAATEISDEILDKLFNGPGFNDFKEVKKNKQPAEKAKFEYPVPQSTAQFYTTWKELSKSQKYLYLKKIEPVKFNTLLGAGLDSETLSDILVILREYYIKHRVDIIKVLLELSKNNEIPILSLFFSPEDKNVLQKLIDYMERRKDNSKSDILYIKSRFNML